jgi:hypothetical protein
MNASAIGLPGALRGSWYEGQRVISYLVRRILRVKAAYVAEASMLSRLSREIALSAFARLKDFAEILFIRQ